MPCLRAPTGGGPADGRWATRPLPRLRRGASAVLEPCGYPPLGMGLLTHRCASLRRPPQEGLPEAEGAGRGDRGLGLGATKEEPPPVDPAAVRYGVPLLRRDAPRAAGRPRGEHLELRRPHGLLGGGPVH